MKCWMFTITDGETFLPPTYSSFPTISEFEKRTIMEVFNKTRPKGEKKLAEDSEVVVFGKFDTATGEMEFLKNPITVECIPDKEVKAEIKRRMS